MKKFSAKEKAATNRAKARGAKKGKQFVKQPKGVAAKTKRFQKMKIINKIRKKFPFINEMIVKIDRFFTKS